MIRNQTPKPNHRFKDSEGRNFLKVGEIRYFNGIRTIVTQEMVTTEGEFFEVWYGIKKFWKENSK